jgi:hypothetical protein
MNKDQSDDDIVPSQLDTCGSRRCSTCFAKAHRHDMRRAMGKRLDPRSLHRKCLNRRLPKNEGVRSVPPCHIGDNTLHQLPPTGITGRRDVLDHWPFGMVGKVRNWRISAHSRRNWRHTSGSDRPTSWGSEDLERFDTILKPYSNRYAV